MIKIELIAGYIIAFLLGLPFGFFVYSIAVNDLGFQVAKEITYQIDPWNVISLLISVILAVIVLRKLNKSDENDKAERELIINYFNAFNSEFTDKLGEVSKDGTALSYTANILKRYGVRLETLLKLAIEQGFLREESENGENLLRKVRNIRTLLTDTPAKGSLVDDGVKVIKGKLFFSEKQKDKIAYAVYDINCSIFLLVVEINRSLRK